MDARIAKVLAYLRANGAGIAVEALVNFIGPFVIFRLARPYWGEVGGLMASSSLPIAWSLYEFIRKRRVDALSILVLTGIALSLLAFLGGGGVKFLQLRERLVTAAIGLVFLGSVLIGRPLVYYLARASSMRRNPSEAAELEQLRDNVHFRAVMRLMTLVWGFGLLTEAAVSATLVFVLPVDQYLLVSPVVGYGFAGALAGWSFWYAQRQRKRGAERRAAMEGAARTAGEGEPAPGG